MNIIKPKKLQKGDTIGIIAPCGVFKDRERLQNAIKFFHANGFKTKVSEKLFEEKDFLAGEDKARADEIMKFFADDTVNGIICARGGYGAIRIVDMLDYDLIRANAKVFCGFSDVTALSAMMLKRAGLVTYSAPMINADFGNDINDFTWSSFKSILLKNEIVSYKPSSWTKIYNNGNAQGISFGGNLATLVSLCGLDFIPDVDFILFIEDLNEPAYKIDRMLTQLLNIEKFRNNLKGVVLGEFINADNASLVDRVLEDFAKRANVPMLGVFKITHSKSKLTVPVGIPAMIQDGQFVLIND